MTDLYVAFLNSLFTLANLPKDMMLRCLTAYGFADSFIIQYLFDFVQYFYDFI